MRAYISRTAVLLRAVVFPVIALIALALISFGVSLIYLPAGIIVGGVLLLLALIDARRP